MNRNKRQGQHLGSTLRRKKTIPSCLSSTTCIFRNVIVVFLVIEMFNLLMQLLWWKTTIRRGGENKDHDNYLYRRHYKEDQAEPHLQSSFSSLIHRKETYKLSSSAAQKQHQQQQQQQQQQDVTAKETGSFSDSITSSSVTNVTTSTTTTSSSYIPPLIRPCQSKCLTTLGQKGQWVQDWEFARAHGQYPLPRVIPDGPMALKTHGLFQPSPDALFPWPTSWKWMDDVADGSDDGDDCQLNVHVQTTTLAEKCDLLWNRLNIRRIAFYGDSLTESQYTSFVNMFGEEYIDLSSTPDTALTNHHNGTLVCSTTSGAVDGATTSRIPLFVQRDQGGQAYKHSNRTLYKLDPTLESFIRDETMGRVLVMFNIGAHYHNLTWYKEDMQVLLQSLEEMQRPHDLYVFRTTSPGHYDCNPTTPREFNWTRGTRDVPLKSLDELDLKGLDARLYNWDMFQYYNAHTKKVVHEWNNRQSTVDGSSTAYKTTVPVPIMHLLDVYNMTALRRDGHSATGKDCLHYHLPGPVDWWNHLLFAYLQELSRDLIGKEVLNCIP